jgi:hypothetical protein
MPTRCNRCFLIADLIACSTCFRHHYAHHQELMSIIQMVAASGIWCFGFQVVGMVWSWASNKLCNKKTSVASSWHFISTYKSITVSDLQTINDGTSHLNYLVPSFMIMKYGVYFFCKCITNISISPCNEISYKTNHNDRQFNCHTA